MKSLTFVICRKMTEASGAPAAHAKVKIPFLAAAQLGRAPGSGRVLGGFGMFARCPVIAGKRLFSQGK
jgi:hypothetical protein